MSGERIIWGCVALACHAALLFGFRLGSLPEPLPMSDAPIEVSLEADEPAPPLAAVEAIPAPAPPPPPEPLPEPPLPPQPPPEPAPDRMATPDAEKPTPHREPPRPPHPALTAPHKAAPAVVPGGAKAGNGSPDRAGAAGARGDSNARPRFNPTPPYPPEARRLRQEGRVMLAVGVSAEGRAMSVFVSHSSGNALLDQSAQATVRRWTFDPARVGGLPVASKVEVPVTFKLAN